MASWYKHDIAAWMDGTEGLDHESYRVYHVICQLIYLHEGPIRRHDTGIAGRCNMHVLTCRKRIDQLISDGKIVLNADGTLGQNRANTELGRMGSGRGAESRASRRRVEPESVAGTGEVDARSEGGGGEVHPRLGRGAPEVDTRSGVGSASKPLKNNTSTENENENDAPRLDKTRLEKTRLEEIAAPAARPPETKNVISFDSPPKKPKSGPLPPNYLLDQKHRETAKLYGMTDRELAEEFGFFHRYYSTNPDRKSSDWAVTWTSWCARWRSRRKQPQVYNDDVG